jgi:hypothetical protein
MQVSNASLSLSMPYMWADCISWMKEREEEWKSSMRGPTAPSPVVSNIVQLPSRVFVGIPRCFFTYSSIIPTKTSIGFSPTPWNFLNLWCGTQWNLLVLLLIPWSFLYLSATCCLCLKLNSNSYCSSLHYFKALCLVVSTKKTSSARGQQQFLVVGCKEEA